jgi:DNA polymerase (family 10)
MDHQTMTDRLVRAIENPFTRFLGHSTGRLLLGRKPYEMDMAKVIRTAAKCNVAIEINANPARLDIDWRWGGELRRHKTMVSINPDAHGVSGLSDTHYGIGVARKALLPVAQVVNSRSASEVAEWLSRG